VRIGRIPQLSPVAIRQGVTTIALLFTCLANANPSTDEISEITVLGTRLSTPGPQAAEVIDAEQIIERQALTVAELLRSVPGITAIEPGGAGGVTELYVRGADANFTTVFVDGVRLNDPTDARGGAFDFSSLVPAEIQRVEVVRGPFSALYGSGALAGAINIGTRPRNLSEFDGRMQASIGGDDYWSAGALVQGPLGSSQFGVGVNHVDFGEPVDGSTRTVTALSASMATVLNDRLAVDIYARANTRNRSGYPIVGGGPRLSPNPEVEAGEADEQSVAASLTWKGSRRSASATISWLGREEIVVTPEIPGGIFPGVPGSTSSTDFDRLSLLVESRFEFSDGFEWGVGLELTDEDGSSAGVLNFDDFLLPTGFDRDRQTIAPFAEAKLKLSKRLSIFGGIRHDDFSDTGNVVSPRVGFTFEGSENGMTVSAAWGKGRKSASFYALGDSLVGNELLKPEDSKGFDLEVGLPFAAEALVLSIAMYDYKYSNLIDFDFTTFQLVNRTEVDTRGIELRIANNSVGNTRWAFYVARNRNEVEGLENALLHRPKITAGVNATWKIAEQWSLYGSARYEDHRQSSSVPGGFETLASFTLLDATLRREISETLEAQLAIDNITDEYYEAVAGIPSPQRQLRIILRQRF